MPWVKDTWRASSSSSSSCRPSRHSFPFRMLLLSVRDVHSHFELGNPPQKSHFFRGFLSPNCSRKNSVEYCDAGTFFFLFVAELLFQILLNNLFNLRSRISCLRTRVRDCFSHERKRGRGLLDGLSQLRLLVICWKRKVLEQGRGNIINSSWCKSFCFQSSCCNLISSFPLSLRHPYHYHHRTSGYDDVAFGRSRPVEALVSSF